MIQLCDQHMKKESYTINNTSNAILGDDSEMKVISDNPYTE